MVARARALPDKPDAHENALEGVGLSMSVPLWGATQMCKALQHPPRTA